MSADIVLRHDAPVHMRQRTFHLQLAAAAAVPDMVFEALFGRQLRDAGKVLGHILLTGGEHVDAQIAVGLKYWNDGGAAVDAEHYRGRLIGNRRHRRHGDAVAAGGAIGGDHMHAGGA